ncbi:MAG: (4Fe-4S)-binding protein, partial [Anaerolineae bacterium]|nr:(4Fe-4S)-binding protein [Anaerolineae bacterium]
AGADLALLVVEPTVAGVLDLERALGTARHFGVPALVCLNKADLNRSRSQEVEEFCRAEGIPLVGQIPFDTTVTEAMVQGQPITAYDDGPVTRELKQMWGKVKGQLQGG